MNEKVFELLERWEAEARQGRAASVEELCKDCPELAEELHRRIRALMATAWLEDSGESGNAVHVEETEILARLPNNFGRYQVKGLIGSGGFGHVLRGHDPELRRDVAIKVPRPERLGTPEQTERFLEEARSLASLNHPGIVPVHDAGRDDEFCYIVSDLIDGESLDDLIIVEPLEVEEAIRIVTEVGRIIGFAHEQGFVHRDIKPANILIEGEKVFLADFGTAIRPDEIDQETLESAGTLAYMSPEQLGRDNHLDRRTDIYSLGVVLYELLTGRTPYVSSNPVELHKQILNDSPPPLSVEGKPFPSGVERICQKCLAKKANDRYSSASEIVADLQALGSGRGKSKVLIAVVVTACLAGGSFIAWKGSQQSVVQEPVPEIEVVTNPEPEKWQELQDIRVRIEWKGGNYIQLGVRADGVVYNERYPKVTSRRAKLVDGLVVLEGPNLTTIVFDPHGKRALSGYDTKNVLAIFRGNAGDDKPSFGRVMVLGNSVIEPVTVKANQKLENMRVRLHWAGAPKQDFLVRSDGTVIPEPNPKNKSGRAVQMDGIVVVEGLHPSIMFEPSTGKAMRGNGQTTLINSWRAGDQLQGWQHGRATVTVLDEE